MRLDGPPRRTAKLEPACEFCGEAMTGARIGDFTQVVGWVQTRAGGGAHGVTLPAPTGRLACRDCLRQVTRGIDPREGETQGSFL